jgi:hypothetical protein
MSCYVCNPYCGVCKKPRPLPIKCPDCGKFNDYQAQEKGVCKYCGVKLPEREPVHCNYSGNMCLVPCKRSKTDNPQKIYNPCPFEKKRKHEKQLRRNSYD